MVEPSVVTTSECPDCGRQIILAPYCRCGRQQHEVPASVPELRPEHVIVRRFGALVDTLERAEHELIAMAIILTLQHLQADFDRAVTPAEIEAAVRELAPDWAHNPILAIMDPQRTRADGYLEILEPMQLRLTPKAVLRLRVSLHYHRRL